MKRLFSDVIDDMGISKFTWRVFLLVALITITSGICNMFPSYTMSQISKEWNLTPVQTGSLSSWGSVGLFLGAIFSGAMSDAVGRKKALIISGTIFTVCSGLTYFSQNYGTFVLLRTITGFGIGAITPAGVALIAEYVPSKNRGVFVTGNLAAFILGWVLSGALGAAIVPAYGWRALYLFGLVAIPFLIVAAFALPESALWFLSKGNEAKAIEILQAMEEKRGIKGDWKEGCLEVPPAPKVVGVRAVLSKNYLKITIPLWILNFMSVMVVYGVTAWLPTLLVSQGLSVVKSYSFSMLQNFASIVACVSTGLISDRIGRKKNGIIGYTLLAIFVIIFGFITNQTLLLVFVVAIGYVINFASSTLQPILAECYPTDFRATGIAWVQGIGRVGSICGPLVVGALTGGGVKFQTILSLIAIPAAICVIIIAFFLNETKGIKLD